MVESAKKKIKNIHLGFFNKKWQFWGIFLREKGLSWRPTCWRPVHVGARHVGTRYMFTPGTLEPL
jgi:hypothetical protein